MKWPSGRLGIGWSLHPEATRKDLAPVFRPPPAWMCGDGGEAP